MRARTLILFVVAIMLAGGTAMLARSWLTQQHKTEAKAAVPPTAPAKSILVTRGMISRGQILKPADLGWQPWPEGGVDHSYIQSASKSIESFAGWVAREPFGPGEPITEAKIVAPGSRGFLAAALRPGMRAVSVPVTTTSGISGFVFPGDQVDILVSEALSTPGGNGSPRKGAETVLHNVRVIAVDQKLDGKAGEAIVAHNVTLEVTPKQAEEIAVATELGKLSLSLRSLAPSQTEEADADSLSGSGPGTFTLDSDVSQLLAPKDNSVTVLRGNSKSG
jgi:pilus assembly protein CpaB